MRYKLVIFDFDGTLADTLPWFRQVCNQVADRFRFRRLSEEEFERLRGCDAREILKFLEVPLWKVPAVANHMRELMAQDIHRLSLFRGVSELLQQLSQQGYRLALVSSNSHANVSRVMGPATTGLFDFIECGVSLFGKDGKVGKVLAKAGVRAQHAILIGDEIRDFEAAQRIGIAFGAVSWGYNRREVLAELEPRELFTTVEDIVQRLAQTGSN